MKGLHVEVIRAGEAARSEPGSTSGLSARWLKGPTQSHDLDVGLISFDAGAATPPHVHHVGQVLVVTSGRGFVEVDGARTDLSEGDIVITPAGETHTHGAGPDGPMVHLSVTTGVNYVPIAESGGPELRT
jgi:quercetin dioxygenase-like cupin family protein